MDQRAGVKKKAAAVTAKLMSMKISGLFFVHAFVLAS
jgi:hypothetical protein